MSRHDTCFRERLEEGGPGLVALTGGGGKTSLLFALARSLHEAGRRVFCATTTRMLRPDPAEWLDVVVDDGPIVFPASAGRALFAARPGPPDAPGKVTGHAPGELDALAAENPGAWVLVEADGAAGRPVKAPEAREPVVPARARFAVAVLGLDCLGRPLAPETAFRMERVAAAAGLRPGDAITPRAIARLAGHPEGMFKNVPPGARRILFCNKSDLPGAAAAAEEVAAALAERRPDPPLAVFAGSLRTRGLRCRLLSTR